MTCSEEGCDQPRLARGWCKKHYVRWQRTDPERRAKDQAYDRKRRQTEHRKTQDRERLRRKRRARGVQPRRSSEEVGAERRAKRKAARHRTAQARLDRAALGLGRPRKWIAGPCPGCGVLFVARSGVCSKTCRKRLDRWADRDAHGNHRERARRLGVSYEPVDVKTVMERDGYRCQLCGIQTHGEWPAPTAATLDHIVPMAVGGPHSYANVQCACSACNSRKGAGAANDQLRLDLGEGRRGRGTVAQAA